ncbi:MAG: hypothetical protein ABWX90_01105 [Candidatus Saccharimonadales bacterium]
MPASHLTKKPSSRINFSPLRTNIKNDRWSPLASAVYAVTASVLGFNMLIIGGLFDNFYLPALGALLVTSIIAFILILISRVLFRRVNPAKVDDLLAFAEANNMSARTDPPSTYLSKVIRIMTVLNYYAPPTDWRYRIDLWLDGSYKQYPISLYNLSLDFGVSTDSAIEKDMLHADYAILDTHTSITLTIQQGASNPSPMIRKTGVILWTLPDLSPERMEKIQSIVSWRVADIQTDGKQLAILLPSTLPYERSGMIKLYQLLDRIHAAQ